MFWYFGAWAMKLIKLHPTLGLLQYDPRIGNSCIVILVRIAFI